MNSIEARVLILVVILTIPTSLAFTLEPQHEMPPAFTCFFDSSNLDSSQLFLLPPQTTFSSIETTNHEYQKTICSKPQTKFYTTNKSIPNIYNIDNKDFIYTQPYYFTNYKIGFAEYINIFTPTTYYNSGYKYTTTSISFKITTSPIKTSFVSQKDLQMYIPLIENPSVLNDFNFNHSFQPSGTQTNYDYVIITNESLYDTFNTNFKSWKIANDDKISNIRIINISNITSDPTFYVNGSYGDAINFSNGNPWIADGEEIHDNYTLFNDTQCKIRNFIRWSYNNTNTRYVLLGGNYQIVPTRYVRTHASGDGCVTFDSDGNHSCDLYYSNLHKCQNNDTINGWMLNPCCGYPWDDIDWGIDLYVGRVLATNPQQLNYWINKTKAYVNGDKNSNYYSSGIDAARDNSNVITNDTWYNLGGENSASLGDEFPTNRTFVDNQNISSSNWSLINDFCNGAISGWDGISLILQSGHASECGGLFYDEYNPSTLNNTNNPNFWYGEGCQIGEFGTPSICGVQSWMNDQNCTFAAIGNSAYGWFGASTYFVEDMMRQMFNESAGYNNLTFCQAHAAARTTEGYSYADGVWAMIFKETNFFGDPALEWQWQVDSIHFVVEEDNDWYNGTTLNNGTPIFTWSKISGASSYNLVIANDSLFTDIILNITDINKYVFPDQYEEYSDVVNFTIPNHCALTDYKTYYCRVRVNTI